MSGPLVRASLVALTIGGLAWSSVASAASPWSLVQVAKPSSTVVQSELDAVSSLSASDIWTVGSVTEDGSAGEVATPLVEHWNGAKWSRLSAPPIPVGTEQPSLDGVVALSASDVWVTGYEDSIKTSLQGSFVSHWDGKTWTTHDVGASWGIAHLAVFSASDVWVLGGSGDYTRPKARYQHWNGKVWSQGKLAALPSGGPASADWAPTSSPTFVPGLLHWDGTSWMKSVAPKITLHKGQLSAQFSDVVQVSSTSVWLDVRYGGDQGIAPGLGIWHWNGTSWKHIAEFPGESPLAMTTDQTGGVWVLSGGVTPLAHLLHIVGGKITATVSLPTSGQALTQFEAMTRVPKTQTLYGVGGLITDGKTSAVIGRYTPGG
jgi:hypothetical protein